MGKDIMYITLPGQKTGEKAVCPRCGGKKLRLLPKGIWLPDILELLALLLFGGIATVILSEGLLEILDEGWILRMSYEQLAACRVPVQTVSGGISYLLIYLGMRSHIQHRHEKDGITVGYAYCRRCEWVYRMRYAAGTKMANVWEEKPAQQPVEECLQESPEEA